MIEDARNQLVFSVTSIWEVAIKSGLGGSDFRADARLLRRGLLANGYDEMAIAGEHVVAMANLPPIHKDPFDRLLVATVDDRGHPADNHRSGCRTISRPRAQGWGDGDEPGL